MRDRSSDSAAREERPEELTRFLGSHSMHHRAFVVEARVRQELVPASDRTGLRVIRAECHETDPCVHQRAGTHRTRFEGDDKRAIIEPPAPERSGCIPQRKDFGVGGGIVGQLPLVVPARDDLTGTDARHDRTDGDVAVCLRRARFVERKPHEVIDCFPLHNFEPTPLLPRRRADVGLWACGNVVRSTGRQIDR